MEYQFDSQLRLGATLPDFTQDQVKNEPMFFNCTPKFAMEHGGPITRAFLQALEDRPEIFDSRVHMLMPGWFPAIPGYHHDDVPRGSNGQPDYDAPAYRSRHAMALINGEIAPTDFAIGQHALPKVAEGTGPIYKIWHNEVEKQLANGMLTLEQAVSNRILYFDWQTMHQATRAVKNGWRWFGRASYQTDRKPSNEIRRQVQVYLENPMEGW